MKPILFLMAMGLFLPTMESSLSSTTELRITQNKFDSDNGTDETVYLYKHTQGFCNSGNGIASKDQLDIIENPREKKCIGTKEVFGLRGIAYAYCFIENGRKKARLYMTTTYLYPPIDQTSCRDIPANTSNLYERVKVVEAGRCYNNPASPFDESITVYCGNNALPSSLKQHFKVSSGTVTALNPTQSPAPAPAPTPVPVQAPAPAPAPVQAQAQCRQTQVCQQNIGPCRNWSQVYQTCRTQIVPPNGHNECQWGGQDSQQNLFIGSPFPRRRRCTVPVAVTPTPTPNPVISKPIPAPPKPLNQPPTQVEATPRKCEWSSKFCSKIGNVNGKNVFYCRQYPKNLPQGETCLGTIGNGRELKFRYRQPLITLEVRNPIEVADSSVQSVGEESFQSILQEGLEFKIGDESHHTDLISFDQPKVESGKLKFKVRIKSDDRAEFFLLAVKVCGQSIISSPLRGSIAVEEKNESQVTFQVSSSPAAMICQNLQSWKVEVMLKKRFEGQHETLSYETTYSLPKRD